MTINGGKPHRVGDQGQRYEVRFKDAGYTRALGWTNDIDSARDMAQAVQEHPSWASPSIIDRKDGNKEVT